MATVNAGTSGPINMLNLQLANLQYGNVPIYDGGQVRIDNGGGRFVDFRGSFSYPMSTGGDAYGGYDYYGYPIGPSSSPTPTSYYPNAGAITQLSEMTAAGASMNVTGLSVDAPSFFDMAQARNADGILNTVFGGADAFNGSAQGDSLDGYNGDDSVLSAGGDDVVRGLDGNDSIDGGLGNDDVNGNKGEDNIRGGDGNDIVRGGQGADLVFGDGGDDPHVNGNFGDDTVRGGAGNDGVFGGQGADMLFGDEGNDTLSGDLGADTMTGGAGADRFLFRVGSGLDRVADFNSAEGDRVQLAVGQLYTITTVSGSVAIDIGGGESLTLAGVSQASLGDWLVVA